MFIDEEWKEEKKQIPDLVNENASGSMLKNPYFLVGLAIFVSLFLLLVIVLSFLYKPNISFYTPSSNNKTVVKDVATSSLTGLPIYSGDEEGGSNGELDFNSLKAENLRFGQFYEAYNSEVDISLEEYQLPLNIKSDVINYHDLSRKIDISAVVEELNNNGFAIIDDQLNAGTSDFYSMQRQLQQIGSPLLLTTDMVWYYHQNSLKTVFKEIEKNVFYEYVWDINKKLYDISLARYRRTLSDLGQVNDVVLEAQRLETAFLATTLALLKPQNDQIIWDENFVNENMFSAQESDYYFFDMPVDIARDVDRELAYIASAKATAKSPVMLYDLDYSRFVVPSNYEYSAKLKNYYLAVEWLRNSFPLYYQNENCPECTLDYNDWLINFVAAHYLSKDLGDNQDLKNKWAVVYKFIAFFEGLRSELTYLHYNQLLNNDYSENYDLSSIFSEENLANKDLLKKFQTKLSEISFLPIEGGIDRRDIQRRKDIGMRLLQPHFWPNDYIFDALKGEDMFAKNLQDKESRITMCSLGKENKYRCAPFGADVLSILNFEPRDDDYYNNNIDYSDYESRISLIQNQLDEFDTGNWNSNMYWMNYNLAQTQINFFDKYRQKLSLSEEWKTKNQASILGAWVNMSLPDEEFVLYEEANNSGLGQYSVCNDKNYIEPNLSFYRDLLARGKMLYDAINVLPVGKKTNVAAVAVKEINSKIEEINNIVQRELEGRDMEDGDCRFIADFSTGLKVERSDQRFFQIEKVEGKNISESVQGNKLLVLVYVRNGQKILAVGPIFNYQEGVKKK